MKVPSGCVQILPGPRPQSEQWPKQSKSISTGRVVLPQTRHDPDSVMSNARSRIARWLRGVQSDVSQPLSTLCRRHVHWQRFSQFNTALQAPNLSLHPPGSAWRQSAKGVETAKAELADELKCLAFKQEVKSVFVSTPFSVDLSRVLPDVEAEFKKMQEVIASLQQELSALRSGQVGVPQTEPDSSEADGIHLLRALEDSNPQFKVWVAGSPHRKNFRTQALLRFREGLDLSTVHIMMTCTPFFWTIWNVI